MGSPKISIAVASESIFEAKIKAGLLTMGVSQDRAGGSGKGRKA